MINQLHGPWPTMVTPFDAHNHIDRSGYRELINWYIDHKAEGLYANCATSEMDLLTIKERLVLVEDSVRASDNRVPVAATGNLGETVEEQLDSCLRVAGAGTDIVMLVVPVGYEKDVDLERYFMTFVEHVETPLGLYEWPIAGMRHLSLQLVKKLAATGRFLAYKETSCDIDKIRTLLEITKDTKLSLLQANMPYLLEFVKAGGRGTMSIASAWIPDLVAAVIESGRIGDQRAVDLQRTLCAMDLAQRTVHPAGTKYLLGKRGVPIASATRRKPHDLTSEQIYALDCAAEYWFGESGDLRILS